MLKWIMVFMMMVFLGSAAEASAAEKEAMPFPLGKDISDRFTGTVHRNDLISADDVYKVPQSNVITFEPGSYSGWHTHGAMTVIGVKGIGLYQEWGKKAVLIKPGDVVQIPAGVSHFHGATKDSRFQQIVIYDKDWQAPADLKAHTGMVSEKEYSEANRTAVENSVAAAAKKDENFLFAYPPEPFNSPNFNKPVHLSKVLTSPNEANSPEWIYVVFPQGTYNRWHSHKTGQILIATDGVGQHQLKGGKLETLHPGDVVYCPPGAVHWHGAAPYSSFAHIAISPQDNHDVTWYDFPVQEYESLKH
ncbi:MAG: cupin domain-containing protein [Selenomonas sp.]|uniref:cupin domain-containing protein n=1 Tax=Selenomonas sp. TaxID=2053611 RepID=UPI0025F9D261|nr:cupin domain-containing protein [Selenomonas sp.]MCR5757515.1 cupin domain-containing protein [Selenomonas sp.]